MPPRAGGLPGAVRPQGWVSAVGIARGSFSGGMGSPSSSLVGRSPPELFRLTAGCEKALDVAFGHGDNPPALEGAMVAANERFGRMPRAVVMLAVLLGATGAAQAADRFVSMVGSDAGNDCLSIASPCRTLAYALAHVASGDTLKVARGRYDEGVSCMSIE